MSIIRVHTYFNTDEPYDMYRFLSQPNIVVQSLESFYLEQRLFYFAVKMIYDPIITYFTAEIATRNNKLKLKNILRLRCYTCIRRNYYILLCTSTRL